MLFKYQSFICGYDLVADSLGSMATKKPQVLAYLEPDINEVFDRLATSKRRSRSLMAAILIEEALIARGLLPQAADGSTAVDA